MKIVFATDGSEYSEGAARFVTCLDLSENDEILIMHAVNWFPVISEWETIYVDLRDIKTGIAPKVIKAAEKDLKPAGTKISTSITEGYPDKEIIALASASGADLIVMGSSGVRGIGAAMVGSTTKLVAIGADKPVLAVKPPQFKKKGKLKILFATDGSLFSDEMAEFLSSMPFHQDAELKVLNIMSSPFTDIPERFAVEIDERIKNVVARERKKESELSGSVLEKAVKSLAGKFSSIEKIARYGDPAEEIIKASEEMDIDIIALGSSGMRGIRGMLGSVSRHVLNHSVCSVLIGKA